MQLAKAGVHGFSAGEKLLELQAARFGFHVGVQDIALTIDTQVVGERAAGHAEVERLERQHPVLELYMSDDIVERQVFVAVDASAFETHVGIHEVPRFTAYPGYR